MTSFGAGVCGLLLLLGACSGSESPSAETACVHFHNVAGDVEILSDEELRLKLKEVHDTASNGDDSQVEAAAREMLATFTSGGWALEFNQAVREMSDACDPYRG